MAGYPADDAPGAVTVQPPPAGSEEDGSFAAFADGQVNRTGGARCERDGDDLAALSGDDQRAVAAFGAQALNIRTRRLRHPQPVQGKQGDKSVLGRRAEPGGDQEASELVAVQAGGVRLVIDPGPADMGKPGSDPATLPRPHTGRTQRSC
jgi:hypothetical protein